MMVIGFSPGNPGQPDIALVVLVPTCTGRLETNERKVDDVTSYGVVSENTQILIIFKVQTKLENHLGI